MAHLISRRDLPKDGNAREFQGRDFGNAPLSFIWVEAQPGDGPRLHRHAYEEVFIVLEGNVTFTVGDEKIDATTDDVLVVPAGVPHTFVNNGPGVLRQIDIHASDHYLTEWLED